MKGNKKDENPNWGAEGVVLLTKGVVVMLEEQVTYKSSKNGGDKKPIFLGQKGKGGKITPWEE